MIHFIVMNSLNCILPNLHYMSASDVNTLRWNYRQIVRAHFVMVEQLNSTQALTHTTGILICETLSTIPKDRSVNHCLFFQIVILV